MSAAVSLVQLVADLLPVVVDVATRASDTQRAALAAELVDLRERARRIVPLSSSIHDAVARRAEELSPSSTAPTGTTLGELAFTAYRLQRGARNHDGSPTPTWTELTDGVREGWEAAAAAVRG